MSEPNNKNVKCACCGMALSEIPLSFNSHYPDYYFSIPEEEVDERIELSESLCAIDDEYFFHRGRLIIPIIDHPEDLIFDVWATLSQENFDKRIALWEKPARVQEAPYFGYLQTEIPGFDDTINVEVLSKEQEVGIIPLIKIKEDRHPLKLAQVNGISIKKAIEISNILLNTHHRI